jgi:hypothetical protein
MNQVINFQKGSYFITFLIIMFIYNNFSLGSYLYLYLHGMYGFFWVLKDFIFPNKSF